MLMSDTTIRLIEILLVILSIPFSYICYFLIWQLPKQYGFVKRWTIVFVYIFIFAVDTYFLSEGLIGLFVYLMIPIFIQWIGAYYFRKELKEELRRIYWKLKNE